MRNYTFLCQQNGGCFGCCGRNLGTTSELKLAIAQNTKEFNAANPQTTEQLLEFRERYHSYNLLHGLCRNLIEKEGQAICPLHPMLNSGKDLREGHCDAAYFCATARLFSSWKEEKQTKFLDFITNKKLDRFDFSKQMES